ncbi:MAG: cytochrome C oxidase subunit I [Chloroflexi bacterium HGW-Chloroflexi-10]|jgi:cytochrome c oxidase subunit 1|nr:MAG: cytochrome C oxidase subunit I [Chloroflexi bacterium HGW-Chloroflexi-10]
MKKFFSLGIIRGLLFQLVGSLIGAGIMGGIRALIGLPWKTEPAIVLGGLFGTIFFIIGLGGFRDWWRMAIGEPVPEPHEIEEEKGGWRYFGFSLDHKVIGIQYGVLSMILLSVGGSLALIFRVELAQSGLQILNFVQFNTLVGLHGMVLIAAILMGIAAVSNFVVPLQIGAADMAFPRLNAFSFWIAVPATFVLLSAMLFGGFETGWTAYPPLSVRGPMGIQMFFLGVYFVGWSSILGALNLIVTIIRMRAKGMSMFKIPIFVWSVLATSLISMTATQLIGLSFQLVMFERLLGMSFFTPANGGNPILFQHLFWFYSHPAVYIFVLPGLGIISELLPVFVRKPLFGYKWVAMSSMGIALTGFLVWGHHMFTAGIEEYLRVPFMYSTLLVAVPTGVKFFSWMATLWQGKLRFPVPMLFTLGAIIVFLMGGLTGPPSGTVSTDLHLHDTYYIVGHFHNTMFGGFIFPIFAAIYYWYPKITGRKLNDVMGKIHFYLMTPAFLVMSFGQMQVGLLGMRRRIADYDPALKFDNTQMLITIGGFLIGIAVLIFFINLIYSAKHGEEATGNVWKSRSPEWTLLPSPVPAHNYAKYPFQVVGEPYDYGLAGSKFVELEKESASADKEIKHE